MRFTQLFLIFLAVPFVSSAAVLSNTDYRTAGDGLIVHDSARNVDFLKLSVTLGQSVAGALSLNPSFRLATPTEVLNLFADVGGFTALDGVARTINPDVTSAYTLYSFFGASTFVNYGSNQYAADLWGHVSRPGSPAVYDMYAVHYQQSPTPVGKAQFYTLGNCLQCSSSIEANYLIRASAAPEPGTVIMLSVGCFGFMIMRRRKPRSLELQ